jgi:hypothetical protein
MTRFEPGAGIRHRCHRSQACLRENASGQQRKSQKRKILQLTCETKLSIVPPKTFRPMNYRGLRCDKQLCSWQTLLA